MSDNTEEISFGNRPLSSDRPIEKAAQDRLGYAPFTHAIASSIVKRAPSDGIVYAIHGPWGSGKTSAVNMLVESANELQAEKGPDERIIVVRFNPWWFSEQSDLTRIFFSELASTLEKKATKKVSDGFRKVGRQFTGAKDLISAALSLAPGGGLAAPILKGALGAIEPYLQENDSLDGARQELISALKEQGRRILVIVDDVDRLPNDEIKQIFRLVKSVADLPNVIYLLVFDREIANRAVSDHSSAEGPEWLEKIVQASFDLPPVHPVDLRKMLIEGINELAASRDSDSNTRYVNMMFECVFPWIKTPRDVGRLPNALTVSLPPIINEVNISDFIAIETLRIFEPQLYHFIRINEGRLTGLSDKRMQDDNEIGKELLAKTLPNRAKQVKSALKRLFPRLQSVWDNQFYGEGFGQRWDRDRLICIPRHFDAYFSFTPGDDTLRSNEILKIMQSIHSIESFSAEVVNLTQQKRRNGTTKAALVFDVIQSRSSDLTEQEAFAATKTLLNVGHLLSEHHDCGSAFVAFPFTWNYWFTLSPLLKKVSAENRLPILLEALSQAPSLVALTFVVTALEGEHGLHEGGGLLPPEQRTVDGNGLNQLQASLIDRIQCMAADSSLLKQPDLRQLLFRWSEAAGAEAVRAWSAIALSDDPAVLSLASAVLSRGSTQGLGDYVATTYYQLNREDASKYVDVDILAQRLTQINAETDGGIEIAQHFLKALNAKNNFNDLPDN